MNNKTNAATAIIGVVDECLGARLEYRIDLKTNSVRYVLMAGNGETVFKTYEYAREAYDSVRANAAVPITYGNPKETDDGTTYTLPELAEKVHIDSWVEGISAMCVMDEIRKEVYDMAGMVEDEDDPICPGEFEMEYTELADKYKFRFNRKGQIVSYDMTKK